MPAKATNTLGDLARQVQAQVADARKRLIEARGQLAALQTERRDIINRPMHSSDIRAVMIQHIEREAQEAQHAVRSLVLDFVKRCAAGETEYGHNNATYCPIPNKPDAALLAALLDAETTADRLLSIAALEPDPAQGLPIAERKVAVAKLDDRIAQLTAEIAEISEALQAAGVREDAEPAKPSAEDGYQWTNKGWIRKEDIAA